MTASHDNAGIAAWNFQLQGKVTSYAEAETFLDGANERTIGPRMMVWRSGIVSTEYVAVILYATEIIRFYPDGTFSVDNGGHATPTTRERLQTVVPDGFRAFHHSTPYVKRKLGLWGPTGVPAPTRGREQDPATLWPLDHTVRIDPTTGRKVLP